MRGADARTVSLVATSAGRARVAITGTSMRPLLRAGMVVDVEPLTRAPRIGEILVFESERGLVAHRFVGERRSARSRKAMGPFVTAGDAHPNRVERVPPQFVVGRVAAIWSDPTADAKRIDGPLVDAAGWLYARTRRLRAGVATARSYGALIFATDLDRIVPPPAFAALVAATRHFEARRFAAAIEILRSVPERDTIDAGRRHHASGALACWLEEAGRVGIAVPDRLRDAFQRTRWNNALQAGRVLRTVRDVRDRFVAAKIPYVILKGGARLTSGEPGAELHFSCDVDVLVEAHEVGRALGVLRAASYTELFAEARRAKYESHHHRSPLRPPAGGVPVEVHVALVARPFTSELLDFSAFAAHRRYVDGPVGAVVVLDEIAAALHLAYHARDLHVWRDVILLARKLASFSPDNRARFDALVKNESHDAVRLASVVGAADRIRADADVSLSPASTRYLNWVTLREDLPRDIPSCDVIEAVIGRCSVESLRIARGSDLTRWLRVLVKNLAFVPLVIRVVRYRRRVRASVPHGNDRPDYERTGWIRFTGLL